MARILVVNGHADPSPERFAAALAEAYARGAAAAGHAVDRLAVADVPVEFLRNAAEFAASPPEPVARAQERIAAADHLVLVYPLWLGTMPARLKAFLEQVARGEFLLSTGGDGWPARKMRGKSARVIVTMGMPAIAYRLFFGAHSLRALEKGILGMAGFAPVRDTVLGGVEGGPEKRARMLATVEALGRKGG